MCRKMLLLIASITCVVVSVAPPAHAGQMVSGYKLERGEATVPFGRDVRMWSCWEPGRYTNPSLYAWTGRSWSRWAKGEISSNSKKCNKGSVYVVFSFRVSQPGTPKKGKNYNVVRVKETCRGCEPYVWLLPVSVPRT